MPWKFWGVVLLGGPFLKHAREQRLLRAMLRSTCALVTAPVGAGGTCEQAQRKTAVSNRGPRKPRALELLRLLQTIKRAWSRKDKNGPEKHRRERIHFSRFLGPSIRLPQPERRSTSEIDSQRAKRTVLCLSRVSQSLARRFQNVS